MNNQEMIKSLEAIIEALKAEEQLTKPTTFDFGNGPVPAHQHTNPDGSIGGWVANSATVSDTAYIGEDAEVFGNAWVFCVTCTTSIAWKSMVLRVLGL